MIGGPSKEQGYQFAVMLASGAPPREAIRYFLPEDSAETLAGAAVEQMAGRWLADKQVQTAVRTLQGHEWTDLSAEEKMSASINKTYVEMAYFLYSRNVVELSGPELSKANTFRSALEAKLAGTAGKLSAVEQFWSDVASGKVKLNSAASPAATASPSVGAAPEGRSPRGQAHADTNFGLLDAN